VYCLAVFSLTRSLAYIIFGCPGNFKIKPVHCDLWSLDRIFDRFYKV